VAGIEITTTLDGLVGARERLARAVAVISPPLLSESLLVGARVFEHAAREHAPAGPGGYRGDHTEGHLRESITIEPDGPTGFRIGPVDVPYAGVQEHGATITAPSSGYLVITTGDGVRKVSAVTVPAHPYLAPAFADGVGPAFRAVEASLTARLAL